jgi:uncharacterized protein (DUF488 family)
MELTNNQQKPPVYSFGYQGQAVEPFARRVVELGATVIDTRLKPYSRNPTWNKSRLQAVLGDRYVWVEALGNLNYKGGPTVIKDLEHGLANVRTRLAAGPVVLICVCADVTDCHRNVTLAALRSEGFLTIEWAAITTPATKKAPALF